MSTASRSVDDGSFYLEEHVYPVAYEVARYSVMHRIAGPLTSTLVAILRDSMEDGDPSLVSSMIELELGQDVLAFVTDLTKQPKSTYAHLSSAEAKEAREAEYMAVVQELPTHIRLVKVIDRINNLLCQGGWQARLATRGPSGFGSQRSSTAEWRPHRRDAWCTDWTVGAGG